MLRNFHSAHSTSSALAYLFGISSWKGRRAVGITMSTKHCHSQFPLSLHTLSSHDNGEEKEASSRIKRVAILLPTETDDNDSHKGSNNDDDDDDDDKCSWIVDGTSRLMHVANEFHLPTLGHHNQQSSHHHHHHRHGSSSSTISLNEGKGTEDEIITTDSIIDKNEQNSLSSSRLLLTAVSHPTTNSYALALVGQSQSQQKQQRQQRMSGANTNKQRATTDALPYVIDLCPSSDTRLGYRLSSSTSGGGGKGGGGGGGGELLIKALGLKKMISDNNRQQQQQQQQQQTQQPIVIYDLTAGFGRDSLVILSYILSLTSETTNDGGVVPPMARLHMMERNPIVGLLLTDAVRRLHLLATDAGGRRQYDDNDEIQKKKKDDLVTLARRMVQCLSMEVGDSTTTLLLRHKLSSSSTRIVTNTTVMDSSLLQHRPPDICYLDPMFPPRKKHKSSAVKKDMAMLHLLLLDDDDYDDEVVVVDEECDTNNNNDDGRRRRRRMVIDDERELLLTAMTVATRRVIVKRPIGALPLGLSSLSTIIQMNIGDDCIAVPRPTYDVRGSTNRFDVYVIP